MEIGCDASSNDGVRIDMHNMAMGIERFLVKLSRIPSLV